MDPGLNEMPQAPKTGQSKEMIVDVENAVPSIMLTAGGFFVSIASTLALNVPGDV